MLKQLKTQSKEALGAPHIRLAILCFCFVLAAYAGWSFFVRVQTMMDWKEKVVAVEIKLPLLETAAQREKELLASLQRSDPLYLERYLSTLRLARLEAYSLEAGKTELADPQLKRLNYLMGEDNTLRFRTGKTVKGQTLQAVEMQQVHTVEVDEKDIQRILACIEGVPIGSYTPAQKRPPMAIKQFSLKRKKETQQRFPSYLLDIELWRREAMQPS